MYRFVGCRGIRARAAQKGIGWLSSFTLSRSVHSLPFATVEAEEISGSQPAEVQNLVQGKWTGSSSWNTIVDPLNGEPFIKIAEVDETRIQPFVESLSKCPKHGLHNPFKSPERYLLYGDISAKAAHMLSVPKVSNFFTRLIQRVAPKSYQQALAEVQVTQKFLENFSGDQVRFLARSFAVPGNHLGQQSHGFRWPYGPVAIITPFNFPLEIPVLQMMGALYMGNKPVLKVDSKVCLVMEQMMRLLHYCGLPVEDADFINSDGKTMNKLLLEANPRMTLFTGSSRVADKLAVDLKGRIKLEDAGFDWKVLGPDVNEVDYVAWVCDQDAYACSGQKCSAQSILFMHENWSGTSLISKMKDLAERRKLEDLTVGPVLTFTTEAMVEHMNKLLQIPGSKLLFGGKPLENHSIPSIYGAIKPTAIYVPLEEILKESNYELVTREIFGPFQIITDYKIDQLPLVLEALERMHAHLTAAVVSNDPLFLQEVIGKTVNGTTYAGIRARTTGAPQNHWFGPAGDPRGAGIGTPEAIKLVCGMTHSFGMCIDDVSTVLLLYFALFAMSLLESQLESVDSTSLANPVTGWQLSQTDAQLIESGKKFFTKLKRKLKDTINFNKDEFVEILNLFLEKIGEKFGISVGVDSSDNGYTQRSDLLCLSIRHAPDLGLTELLCILKYFLCPSKDAYSSMVNVRKEWESQALLAIEKVKDKKLSDKKSRIAKEASILLMLAHDGFSTSELCLHYLLASSNVDEVILSSSIGPCPKASSMLGLKACDWVPKLEDIVRCLGLVLDENFSSLVLHPEFHEELKSIEGLVGSLALEAKLCCSMANVIENLKTEAEGEQS
ncbi:hypothetical protein GH714_021924 [Hevea brasiliensis]|uniref:Aldehyde dehydrogenase domain-containing protein n=2 Tax=Magnoliopsida TaxID=3398 RepID=A0A6A6MDM0_HEVBR|nr:hypothetical protein GH714_021924 [Hevea brasiliensis]